MAKESVSLTEIWKKAPEDWTTADLKRLRAALQNEGLTAPNQIWTVSDLVNLRKLIEGVLLNRALRLDYLHDDYCPTLRSNRGLDCSCDPRVKVTYL